LRRVLTQKLKSATQASRLNDERKLMSEPDVSNLLTVARAIEIIDQAEVHPRVLTKRLSESFGLRLARDLTADRDAPPFDKSLMDGFAVRCADVPVGQAELKVVDEIAAGSGASRALGPSEAMAIMTGAPLPQGADGVVPVEDTMRNGDFVVVNSKPMPGRFITRRGGDCAAGSIVLQRGTKLGPAQIAVAASVGAAEVEVFEAPRTAVLATGDELVDVSRTPAPSQIRNSNNLMVAALLRRMECAVDDFGIAGDDHLAIESGILRGLDCDALFISGGMSMGVYDLVPKVLASLGAVVLITKLRIKPGKPFVYAYIDRGEHRCHVFGLPGNPVSGFACTLRLASRLLTRLAGGEPSDKWLHATLKSPLPANGAREFYQPAVHNDGDVTPLEWKGSADVFTLAKANAMIVRAENEPALDAGARVRLLEIPS
jgi:molybdopterin molybdotransferase